MAMRNPHLSARRDILQTENQSLSEALVNAYADSILTPPGKRKKERTKAKVTEDAKRLIARAEFIEPLSSDPHGLERIVGESDLISINYLDRGRRAAAAVCRITVPASGGAWYGTGFLVGPRLLMTNHHVLKSLDDASQCEAEFDYEHDLDGVLKTPIRFNLRPHELFYSNPELDVTFVGIAPLSDGSVPIERYGWLPLLPQTGKAFEREWVTIIQHPQGDPKQISIRANQVVSLKGNEVKGVNLSHFIHYLTDTEPGSSGAPVLNDQWQVVALHHKAVPAPAKARTNGPTEWIANEGVRVSAIYDMLEERRFEDDDVRLVLERLESSLGLVPELTQSSGDPLLAESTRPFQLSRWKKKTLGYDPNFIDGHPIDFDAIYAKKKAEAAPLLNSSGHELKYKHFSIVIHEKRKFAMLTAVNMIGSSLKNLSASSKWRTDSRIADKYQPADNFYKVSEGKDKVAFSRGHQVRRLDPCWGSPSDAKLAEEDSFHFTNAAPQVQKYNDSDWGNLEDYILARALTTERRMSVFTGPIFRANDPWYGRDRTDGPWRIPISFWKIAVLEKEKGKVVAAAFIVGQLKYVKALYEAKVFSGLRPYTVDEMRSAKIQVSVSDIEKETGLNFAAIRKFDAHGSLESTQPVRWITRPDDIVI
jgi:endonuclease G